MGDKTLKKVWRGWFSLEDVKNKFHLCMGTDPHCTLSTDKFTFKEIQLYTFLSNMINLTVKDKLDWFKTVVENEEGYQLAMCLPAQRNLQDWETGVKNLQSNRQIAVAESDNCQLYIFPFLFFHDKFERNIVGSFHGTYAILKFNLSEPGQHDKTKNCVAPVLKNVSSVEVENQCLVDGATKQEVHSKKEIADAATKNDVKPKEASGNTATTQCRGRAEVPKLPGDPRTCQRRFRDPAQSGASVSTRDTPHLIPSKFFSLEGTQKQANSEEVHQKEPRLKELGINKQDQNKEMLDQKTSNMVRNHKIALKPTNSVVDRKNKKDNVLVISTQRKQEKSVLKPTSAPNVSQISDRFEKSSVSKETLCEKGKAASRPAASECDRNKSREKPHPISYPPDQHEKKRSARSCSVSRDTLIKKTTLTENVGVKSITNTGQLDKPTSQKINYVKAANTGFLAALTYNLKKSLPSINSNEDGHASDTKDKLFNSDLRVPDRTSTVHIKSETKVSVAPDVEVIPPPCKLAGKLETMESTYSKDIHVSVNVKQENGVNRDKGHVKIKEEFQGCDSNVNPVRSDPPQRHSEDERPTPDIAPKNVSNVSKAGSDGNSDGKANAKPALADHTVTNELTSKVKPASDIPLIEDEIPMTSASSNSNEPASTIPTCIDAHSTQQTVASSSSRTIRKCIGGNLKAKTFSSATPAPYQLLPQPWLQPPSQPAYHPCPMWQTCPPPGYPPPIGPPPQWGMGNQAMYYNMYGQSIQTYPGAYNYYQSYSAWPCQQPFQEWNTGTIQGFNPTVHQQVAPVQQKDQCPAICVSQIVDSGSSKTSDGMNVAPTAIVEKDTASSSTSEIGKKVAEHAGEITSKESLKGTSVKEIQERNDGDESRTSAICDQIKKRKSLDHVPTVEVDVKKQCRSNVKIIHVSEVKKISCDKNVSGTAPKTKRKTRWDRMTPASSEETDLVRVSYREVGQENLSWTKYYPARHLADLDCLVGFALVGKISESRRKQDPQPPAQAEEKDSACSTVKPVSFKLQKRSVVTLSHLFDESGNSDQPSDA